MRPVSTISATDISRIKLVSFDADGVTVKKGTKIVQQGETLTIKTNKITFELLDKLNRLKKHFYINISSGRNLLYLQRAYGSLLWKKASLQGENGIFTLIGGLVIQHQKIDQEELEIAAKIKGAIGKLAQTNGDILGFEPKQFILSIHCVREIPEISEIVARADPGGKFYVKWNSEAYDIFSKRFSKATGLGFLAKHLGITTDQIMVVGNDPNDLEAAQGVGLSVTTSPDTLTADYCTQGKLELGGEEVADHLLGIVEN